MKATCPKNPEHKRFLTVAHVQEEWVVDEHGTFQEVRGTLDTVHGPNPGNIWCCNECGIEAKVEE